MLPLLVMLAAFAMGAAAAQQSAPPSAPVYTAAQAEAGRTAYTASCSGCHLRDLTGTFEAPQLAGSNFLNQWGDKTIGDLYAYLMATMPPTEPGRPGGQAMIDIVAYLLQANGASAGSQPLTPQTPASVRSAIGAPGAPSTASQPPSPPPACRRRAAPAPAAGAAREG